MENEEQLRQMILSFRVSELHMLLAFAGRARHGRKNELQERAFDLLKLNSLPVILKIKSLYQNVLQNPGQPPESSSDIVPSSQLDKENNMHPRGYPPGYSNNPPAVNTRSASIFSNQMYPQQYPPQMRQQQQQPPPTAMQFPIHPDVKFKKLPFYDVIADLLQPSTLATTGSQRTQECSFQFHLTPQQADQLGLSRDIRVGGKTEFGVQVQLRFCLLDTTGEQEDFFPPGIQVKVNGKGCQLPNPIPTNKPGVEPKRPPRPVNITPLVKISPTVTNIINVQWTTDFTRGYVLGLFLVIKRSSDDLLNRLKAKGIRSADYTRGMIKDKLRDSDSEIATTSLRVSLACPLGKMRMVTPCRASTCQHFQCFDASLYLQMNEKKPTWMCPVCDKPILYDNLVIDGYFQDILVSGVLPPDAHDIQLLMDGSWSSINVKKDSNRVAEKKELSMPKLDEDKPEADKAKENKAASEIICLDLSDDESSPPKKGPTTAAAPTNSSLINTPVNTTCNEKKKRMRIGSPGLIVLDEVDSPRQQTINHSVDPASFVTSTTVGNSVDRMNYYSSPTYGNGGF